MVEVPTVIGWLRPVVLMPASALSGMGPQQLEAILAHELAHIRRHDYLVNLLQTLVETLLFYHPAVWWLSGRIRVERENCCDDLAVSLCGDPYTYAKALADLEELRADSSRLVLAATGGSLIHRVRRLIGAPSHAGRGPGWLAGSTAVVLIAGIAAGAVGTNALGSEQVDAVAGGRPHAADDRDAGARAGVADTVGLGRRDLPLPRRRRVPRARRQPLWAWLRRRAFTRSRRPPLSSRRRRWARRSRRLSLTCSNSSRGRRRRCRRLHHTPPTPPPNRHRRCRLLPPASPPSAGRHPPSADESCGSRHRHHRQRCRPHHQYRQLHRHLRCRPSRRHLPASSRAAATSRGRTASRSSR